MSKNNTSLELIVVQRKAEFLTQKICCRQQVLHVSLRYLDLRRVGVDQEQLQHCGVDAVDGHGVLLGLAKARGEHGLQKKGH